MTCPKCNTQNQEGAKFCAKCGNNLNLMEKQTLNNDKADIKAKARQIVIQLGFAGAVAFVIFSFLFRITDFGKPRPPSAGAIIVIIAYLLLLLVVFLYFRRLKKTSPEVWKEIKKYIRIKNRKKQHG